MNRIEKVQALATTQGYRGDLWDADELEAWFADRFPNTNGQFDFKDGELINAAEVFQAMRDVNEDALEAATQNNINQLERVHGPIGPPQYKEYGGSHLRERGGALRQPGVVNPHIHSITGRDNRFDSAGQGYSMEENPDAHGVFFNDLRLLKMAYANGEPSTAPKRITQYGNMITKLGSALTGGQSEGIDSEGGFLVPEEPARFLLRKVYGTGNVFPRARQLRMSSSSIGVPFIVETSRADGSRHGGIQGFWGAEAATMTASRPSYGKLTLTAHKLHVVTNYTQELDDDSTDSGISVLSLLSEIMAEELGFKVDDACINGTGAGQPLGILNGPATIAVGRANAGDVQGVDVAAMWSRMPAKSRPNATWFLNPSVDVHMATLSALTLSTGTDQPFLMYNPANAALGAPFASLYGRPLVPIEQGANLGTVGDLILADMTQYLFGIRKGITSQTSIHVNFMSDQTAFKMTMRVDGQEWWQAPLTAFASGAPTLSPFLTLAT